jgi:hypothetical protein
LSRSSLCCQHTQYSAGAVKGLVIDSPEKTSHQSVDQHPGSRPPTVTLMRRSGHTSEYRRALHAAWFAYRRHRQARSINGGVDGAHDLLPVGMKVIEIRRGSIPVVDNFGAPGERPVVHAGDSFTVPDEVAVDTVAVPAVEPIASRRGRHPAITPSAAPRKHEVPRPR